MKRGSHGGQLRGLRGVEQRVVVITGCVVRIDRCRIDRIKRCVASKALHEIRIGNEGPSERCGVRFTALNGRLCAFLRQAFIENVGPLEDASYVVANSLCTAIETLPREDERDVARAELDIRFRCTPTRSAGQTVSTASSASRRKRARFSIEPP